MKLQSPFPRPTAANGALLPAGACLALLALAGLQLALTGAEPLPDAGWSGGAARAAVPALAQVATDPILGERPIFSPERGQGGAGGSANLPLGGATVAGAVTVGGRARAVVALADGRIVQVPIGGSVAGARLLGLTREGAEFLSGGRRLHVAFGAAPAPVQPVSANEEPAE